MSQTLLEKKLSSIKPQEEPLHLDHKGDVFRIILKRSAAARRLTLRVSTATGRIALTLPRKTSLTCARSFVEAQAPWIAARMARIDPRVYFENGSMIPVRGELHQIVYAPRSASLKRDGFFRNAEGKPLIKVTGEATSIARRVRELLIREARKDLEEAVLRHTAALGLRAKKITVRDTVSRWGSCSAKGTLNFSWRLIIAPAFVLNYLAAHEVAHLKEWNHSPRFWEVTHALCSETQKAELWLKQNGATLHHYG